VTDLWITESLPAAATANDDSYHQQIQFKFKEETNKCYCWSIALYGAETWTLWKADQKYLESFEMWCWRRMEQISWVDHIRNEDVLRVKEGRNILQQYKQEG